MVRSVVANLVNLNTIEVIISGVPEGANYIFTLVINEHHRHRIDPYSVTKSGNTTTYHFRLNYELELGEPYQVAITNLGVYVLNVNAIANLPNFDKKYYYSGDDLGYTYKHHVTSFALWAPLASSVILIIDNERAFIMKRTEKGVYRISIHENLKNHTYYYQVTNSGRTVNTLDPYGKASTINSKANVILNLDDFKINMNDKKLTKMNSILDAIIYEGSVRDLTSDLNTNIKYKGTFLGLSESKRVNKDGLPVGYDYITSLGITHLQLLPIYDFATIDETRIKETYNWGYDPLQYFIPEGSYASHPLDPTSRIRDLLTLVSSYHNRGVRIVMDVVFNHVYEHQFSSFEATVPNYYFRRTKDGSYFNASGCGNDFASERLMARKLIVDACKWWASYYHIDGFRFDLMGLIDTETINQVKAAVFKINPNIIIYGEGWNMMSGYDLTLANSNNFLKVPEVAFFNDNYRDVVIGNLNSHEPGFGLDNIVYRDAFKEVVSGSSFNMLGCGSRFNSVVYTINFVECHDNNTLFDKIQILRPNDSLNAKLKRVTFINGLVMFSLGVPFFHAGQEIGLSKGGDGNSYRSGDKVNQFDYSLLKARYNMVETFKEYTKIRKNMQIFHNTNNRNITANADAYDVDHGALLLKFRTYLYNERANANIKIFMNPSQLAIKYKEGNAMTIPAIAVTYLKD